MYSYAVWYARTFQLPVRYFIEFYVHNYQRFSQRVGLLRNTNKKAYEKMRIYIRKKLIKKLIVKQIQKAINCKTGNKSFQKFGKIRRKKDVRFLKNLDPKPIPESPSKFGKQSTD